MIYNPVTDNKDFRKINDLYSDTIHNIKSDTQELIKIYNDSVNFLVTRTVNEAYTNNPKLKTDNGILLETLGFPMSPRNLFGHTITINRHILEDLNNNDFQLEYRKELHDSNSWDSIFSENILRFIYKQQRDTIHDLARKQMIAKEKATITPDKLITKETKVVKYTSAQLITKGTDGVMLMVCDSKKNSEFIKLDASQSAFDVITLWGKISEQLPTIKHGTIVESVNHIIKLVNSGIVISLNNNHMVTVETMLYATYKFKCNNHNWETIEKYGKEKFIALLDTCDIDLYSINSNKDFEIECESYFNRIAFNCDTHMKLKLKLINIINNNETSTETLYNMIYSSSRNK